jgi:hypothetical protein
MPKVTANKEYERELIEAGTHFVRLVQIIDLGTHTTERQGEQKLQRKSMFVFELPEEKYEYENKEGKKISGVKLKNMRFTVSWGDSSNLKKFICAWLGDQQLPEGGLDLAVWLGKTGIGAIQHDVGKNGTTYDNLKAVAPLMKGMKDIKAVTDLLYFDLDNFDVAIFDAIPEWIQNIIKDSKEYPIVSDNSPQVEATTDDDLPFR